MTDETPDDAPAWLFGVVFAMALPPAERMRNTRRRKRRKLIVLNVEVDPALLALSLVNSGYLSEDTDDREKLGAGLSKALYVLYRSSVHGFPRHDPDTCGDLDCPVCEDTGVTT